MSHYHYRKTARAAFTIMDGEKELGSFFSTEWDIGKAIDRATGLDVYEGDFEFTEKDDFKLPDKQNSIPWVVIDVKDVPTKITKSRNVACCAYYATSDYMQHHMSMKLDNYDKTWYEKHHLVTQHGLPQRHSFTVIQQLVEPYDAGIRQIAVPRNSQRFEEYKPFILALGANPFFAVDGRTTNEEALERLFPTKELRDKNRDRMLAQWRFECRDQPYKGAIVMKMFGGRSGAGDHNGGSSYDGPRAPTRMHGDWIMSIKLGRLENINYKKPINLPEYKEFAGNTEYDLWKIVDPGTGKTLEELKKGLYKRNSGGSHWNAKRDTPDPKPAVKRRRVVENNNKPAKDDVDVEKVWAYKEDCRVCNIPIDKNDIAYANGMRSCPHCFADILKFRVPVLELKSGGYIEITEKSYEYKLGSATGRDNYDDTYYDDHGWGGGYD